MNEKPKGMVECPIGGCSYKGSIEQVKGHWGGTQDEDHRGKFHEAFEAYNEAREQSQKQASGQAGAQEVPSNEAPQEATDGGGGTKLDLSKLGGSDDSEPEPDGCPSCGTEDWFDATEFLHQFEAKLSAEERSALESSERVCVDCGEIYG